MKETIAEALPRLLREFDLLHLSNEEKQAIYEEVRNNNQMQPGYLLLVLAACMIALLGLLINSTAVVIGAMLISPLMNPFLSAALALTLGDWKLGRQALRTIALSVLAAVLISALAVFISPLKDATSEILARTKPNLMDLLIAFFAGIAGTYTMLVRKGSTTIPGVAIATAVMPPLCVTGFGLYYGIYNHEWHIAGGAFALFITNLVAIVVSAALVFATAHFRTRDQYSATESRYSVRTRLITSFCVLGLISMPLLYSLIKAVGQTRERRQIEEALRKGLERSPEAHIESGWELQRDRNGQAILRVVLRTATYLKPDEVVASEQTIAKVLRRPVTLQLSQVRIQEGGAVEPISAISPVSSPSPQPPTPSENLEGLRHWIEPFISELQVALGAKVENYHLNISGQTAIPTLEILIKSDDPIPPGTIAAAERIAKESWVREGLKVEKDKPVLHVVLSPITNPYVTIRFAAQNAILPEDSQPSLQRFVQFSRAAPLLQPVMLLPATKDVAVRLQQRRKQAIWEALKKEGWEQSAQLKEQTVDDMLEDEMAIRFIAPQF